jgi:hypothetical protein
MICCELLLGSRSYLGDAATFDRLCDTFFPVREFQGKLKQTAFYLS